MKILIVKTSSLGDIIHSFAAVDYLRHRFPQAQIDWVVEAPFAELVRAHPYIDQVFTIQSKVWRKNLFNSEIQEFRKKLREREYDLLFDLQGNVKSGLIAAVAVAKEKVGFGWKTLPEWPNGLFTTKKINPSPGRNIREDYLALVQGYFNDSLSHPHRSIVLKLDSLQQQKLATLFLTGEERPILVCPSSAWPNKCLSEEILAKVLKQLDHTPLWFIWGNSTEREVALRLSVLFAGSSVLERLTLPLLQHVMSRCKLVVAMDSLPLHLCGTTATPTLSYFGPSSAQKYRPLGEKHWAIQGKCPYGIQFEKRCPQLRTCPTGSCLKVAEHIERGTEAAVAAGFSLEASRKL